MTTEEKTGGEFETRKVQQQGRVDIPDDMLDEAGIGVGERVLVKVENGHITVEGVSSDFRE